MRLGARSLLKGFICTLSLLCGLALISQAQAETVKVRVAVIPILGTAPFFVANGEGWLREAGIEPTVITFESGPNIIQAAASGSIDLYVAGIGPVAVARTKGVDLRVVAATAVDENVLAAGPRLRAFFKPGVTAAEAFKQFHSANGRPAKIATQPPGSVPAANLQYWLRKVVHVDPSDVEVLSLGIDATQRALLADAADAAIVREPTLTIIQQRNPQIGLLAKGEDLFPGQPGTIVAVSGSFLQQHPQAVQSIVNGIVRAVAELKASPDRTAPFVAAALSKGIVDAATIKKSLTSPATHFIADPAAIQAPTKAMLDFQVELGALAKAPNMDGLFDSSFYAKAPKP